MHWLSFFCGATTLMVIQIVLTIGFFWLLERSDEIDESEAA